MQTNYALARYGTTIFTVMSALATECGAINLGQGFPDEDGPEWVRKRAAAAIMDGPNQYPPMRGLPELRRAVAEHDRTHYRLDWDWEREVIVTSGATEALAACFLGLIEPGCEVVLFEPVYDSYVPMIERAGGVPRLVRLEPPNWRIPTATLASAFTSRTRLVVLNSPHNPTGKVFEDSELEAIGRLLAAHDAVAICDEVYEHLVFPGTVHRPLASLPGLRERCIRIGSAGKSFSLTGWKVGWAAGPAELIDAVAKAHQFLTFTTPPALQLAVADGLLAPVDDFRELASVQQRKRARLAAGLQAAGLPVLPGMGTYFLVADYRGLGFAGDDAQFCCYLTREAGVAAIPLSAFYPADPPQGFVRFCFCKQDAVLDAAASRLQEHFARSLA